MATASFSKDLFIKEPESIKRLVEVVSRKSTYTVNTELASDKAMDKGRELLKKSLSH